MILDTDVLIDIFRGYPPAVAWFGGLAELPPIAGIAAMEVIAGCRDAQELRTAQALLSRFTFLWPSSVDLDTALQTYLPRRLCSGIGILDAIVAATAAGRGEAIATFNIKHFAGLPEVVVVQPYARSGSLT